MRKGQRGGVLLFCLVLCRGVLKIDEIYDAAVEASLLTVFLTRLTTLSHFKAKRGGLHHQDNLLIVPATENMSKGNKFEPGDLRAQVSATPRFTEKDQKERGLQ